VLLVLESGGDEVFGEDVQVEMSTQGNNMNLLVDERHSLNTNRFVLTSSTERHGTHRRPPTPTLSRPSSVS
jgi:hypothetical protein